MTIIDVSGHAFWKEPKLFLIFVLRWYYTGQFLTTIFIANTFAQKVDTYNVHRPFYLPICISLLCLRSTLRLSNFNDSLLWWRQTNMWQPDLVNKELYYWFNLAGYLELLPHFHFLITGIILIELFYFKNVSKRQTLTDTFVEVRVLVEL